MNYVDFTVNGTEYKLRLTTRTLVDLEKALGCSPLTIFGMDPEHASIPPIETMVKLLHASMKPMNHGITLDEAYDIFDKYLEDGNTVTDFLGVITEIYSVSGLIKIKGQDEEDAAPKN